MADNYPTRRTNAMPANNEQNNQLALNESAQEILEYYKALVDKSPTGILIIQDGLLVFVNPKICEMMGYTPDEVLGAPVWKFLHLEDVYRLQSAYQQIIAGEEAPTQYDAQAVARDGSARYFNIQVTRTTHNGNPAILVNAVDMTDRKHDEEALRESEERLTRVLETVGDGIAIIDRQGRITFANAAAHSILGRDGITGRSCRQVLHDIKVVDGRYPDEDLPFERVIQTGMPVYRLLREVERPGGVRITLSINSVPLRSAEGEIVGVVASFRDITSHRQKDQALRFTQFALDHAAESVFMIGSDSSVIYVNMAACKSLGYTAQELSSLTLRDFDPYINKETWPGYWQELKKNRLYTFESLHRRKDGTTFPVEITSNYLAYEGAEYSWCFVHDITERKRAEKALQETKSMYKSLAEESIVGVYVIQADRFSYVNPKFAEIFGYTPQEMVENIRVPDITAPESRDLVMEHVQKRLAGESMGVHYSFKGRRKDGTIIDVEVQGARTTCKDEPAIIGSLIDITEQKRAQEQLRQGISEMEALLTSFPDLYFWLSSDGTICNYFSNRGSDLYLPPEEFLGKRMQDVLPPDAARVFTNAIEELARAGGTAAIEYSLPNPIGDQHYEARLSRLPEDQILVIVRNITQRKLAEEARRNMEKQLEIQQRQFYRDTIMSVTDGKLEICDVSEIKPYIAVTDCRIDVKSASEVSAARHKVEELCRSYGMEGERLETFMIAAGEAITNAIKHGVRGRVYAGIINGSVWVGVADRGRGIESLLLPKATLRRGFSTKRSLGLGYSIMLDVADRILLKTNERGTVVILIKSIEEQVFTISAEQLPDTWDNYPL